jgi:hypothetical protein
MQMLKKWIATPARRLGTAFLMMIGGVFLSVLFLPFAAIAFLGVCLLLMLGQQIKAEWAEGKNTDCPVCGEKTSVRLVRLKSYMYPILPFVGRFLSIPIGESYYVVCDKCLHTHLEERDLAAILVIAQGGMAYAKEISKQEYDELIK